MLAVAAGIPVRHGAIGTDVFDKGHEGADPPPPIFALLHGHQRVLSDRFPWAGPYSRLPGPDARHLTRRR